MWNKIHFTVNMHKCLLLCSLHPKFFHVIILRFALLARVLYTVLLCSDELKFFTDEIINPEGWARNFTQVYQGFYFAVKWGYWKKPGRCFLRAPISYLGVLWLHSYQGGLSPLSIWWGTVFSVFAGDASAAILHLLTLQHGIWQHCEISNLIVWIHTPDSKTAVIDQSWVKGLKVLTLLLIKPLVCQGLCLRAGMSWNLRVLHTASVGVNMVKCSCANRCCLVCIANTYSLEHIFQIDCLRN